MHMWGPKAGWAKYKLRLRRRRLLLRAFRKKHEIKSVVSRIKQIRNEDVLAFVTLRNEIDRLPEFLDHHRKLGIAHFLIVDNASTDGSVAYLRDQSDVSLWQTDHSYRLSRLGLDWLTWLMIRHGHGHWCLTLDADEIFIYPNWKTRSLAALTDWLDRSGNRSFGALMLDLYPKGPLNDTDQRHLTSAFERLCWYDCGNYTIEKKPAQNNLWIQGGVRAREFFSQDPLKAPTLNKTPLVKWDRRYAYLNSTHEILPPTLNLTYGENGEELTSGILLHTKFLPQIVNKSKEEKKRKQHFENSDLYEEYYDSLIGNPTLWSQSSKKLTGWRALEQQGLMSRGGWV